MTCEKKEIFTEKEICGNINIPCGGEVSLFNTNGPMFPSGLVSVFYDMGCSPQLVVTVTDKNGINHVINVLPGNTHSEFIQDIRSISASCTPPGINAQNCRGKYCFDFMFGEKKKECNVGCQTEIQGATKEA